MTKSDRSKNDDPAEVDAEELEVTEVEDERATEADAAPDDADADADGGDVDDAHLRREDDAFWDDVDEQRSPRTDKTLWIQVGIAALAVLVIAGILIARGSKDQDDAGSGKNNTEQGSDGGATATTKPELRWPSQVGARPTVLGAAGTLPAAVPADAPAGVYLWQDFSGWHLALVNGTGANGATVTGITGTITSNDQIAKAVLAEGSGGTATPAGTTATFDLPGDPRVSQIDFNPGFYANSIQVSVQSGGAPLAAGLLLTGSASAPATLPLNITKG